MNKIIKKIGKLMSKEIDTLGIIQNMQPLNIAEVAILLKFGELAVKIRKDDREANKEVSLHQITDDELDKLMKQNFNITEKNNEKRESKRDSKSKKPK